jgi:alpha/beta superfamily hydrolase
MWRTYPFEAREVCCQKTTLSFIDSVWEIFGPLLAGVRTVIIPDEAVKDPYQMIEALAANHVTRILLVPSLLRVLLDTYNDLQRRLPDLKIWVTSGEEISLDLAQRFRKLMPQAKLINLYGSSEVSADVTCYELEDAMLDRCVPIGQPIDNTSVYILDSYLQPVPIGLMGEMYIGGIGLARGYLNRPDLTSERFITSPFRQEEILFKTGDLGRYLPDGNIEYLGRRDHQVKVRGFRVELGEIEARVKEVEAVADCAVVLREDHPADIRLVAYYVVREGQTIEASELRRNLQTKLPGYMMPQHFVKLASIPLTSNGKADRKALPKPVAEKLAESRDTAPKEPMEKLLGEIWRDLLGVDRVCIQDNFFDLGGHSLLSMRVVARLEKAIGLRINPGELIFQTLGQLASYCEKRISFREQSKELQSKMSNETRTPFYFGSAEKQLYGCYHAPQTAFAKDCGIVLCYPMGNEYIKSHRTYLQLAARLSKAGFPVIRFDYYGTGDSSGGCEQGNIGQWIADISEAVEELKRRSGLSKACLVGLRLGGSLSMIVGAQRSDIDSLVLWEPIVHGETYISELKKLQKQMLRFSYSENRHYKKDENFMEILGFSMHRFEFTGLAKIDLLKIRQIPSNNILLLQSSKNTSIQLLREHLMIFKSQTEYQQINSPLIWLENVYKGLVPHKLLNSVVSWILGVYP